jgi:hypothetical protein
MALNRRPCVQSDLADVIKTSFFSPFILGPIRPRAVRQGGAKEAVGERVKAIMLSDGIWWRTHQAMWLNTVEKRCN